MGTDAMEFFGYSSETTWSENPRNIRVIQPNFYANRRNNISIISVDDLKLEGGYLGTSGIEVSGDQSGRLPLPVNPQSSEIWSSPAIDIEPEIRCTINNVEINGTVIDGFVS